LSILLRDGSHTPKILNDDKQQFHGKTVQMATDDKQWQQLLVANALAAAVEHEDRLDGVALLVGKQREHLEHGRQKLHNVRLTTSAPQNDT
jgi:hypothetical protein